MEGLPGHTAIEAELAGHARALRALARLLVDAGAAEDLVQDTALAALQSRPHAGGGLRGWLATVLRRLASNHRRSEARRRQHEGRSHRGGDEPPRDESAARVAERHEAVRRVTEAVLALPEPYHTVVLLRFFEDLTPTAIAQQTGAPLATVKSQLQRGLALLRERLERGGLGADWRSGLAVAFGIEHAGKVGTVAAASAAATTATTGVALMAGTTKVAFAGVLVAALAVSAVWLWPRPAPVAATGGERVAASAPAVAVDAQDASPVAESAANAPRAADAGLERTAATGDDRATLRGRCVDRDGRPLAGVHVELSGWIANGEQRREWLRTRGQLETPREQTTTAEDGTFGLRFLAPRPFRFYLRLCSTRFAAWSRRWDEWPADRAVDLGDLTLEPGTLVRGRVIDSLGKSVSRAQVSIRGEGTKRADTDGIDRWSATRTDSDGVFVCDSAVGAGDYELSVDQRDIEGLNRVTLAGSGDEQFVAIVVKATDDANAITGTVVDDTGDAVARAQVSLGGRRSTTDADGRFRIERPAGELADRVRLQVRRDGYDMIGQTEQLFAWGQNDVRIELRKGREVSVLVVRADNASPVEDYALRIAPVRTAGWSSQDVVERGGPVHPAGREQVSGIKIGSHQVLVSPRDPSLATAIVPIEVAAAGAPLVVVRLAATTERTVRVQRPDGDPVVGSEVKLIDPVDEPLTIEVPVCTVGQWSLTTAHKALELTAATTDAAGLATVRAPTDRPLGLLVDGATHTSLLVPQAVFPPDGPLVVTVTRGATLRGKVVPDSAIAEIRRLAGIVDPRAAEAEWPRISLRRRSATTTVHFPGPREMPQMQPDGTFELTGIPAGRWRIEICCSRRTSGGSASSPEHVGSADFADGQTTMVTLDLRHLLPGELDATVLHNGAPLHDTPLTVEVRDDGVDGEPRRWFESVRTDRDGHFRVTVRGGEATLLSMPHQGHFRPGARAAERARITPGAVTQQTFHIVSGTVKLHLLDAAGKPVAGIPIELRNAAGEYRQRLAPTDADGRAEAEVDVEPLTAFVLPQRLQDRDAQAAFYRAHTGEQDPTASVLLNLGDVHPQQSATTAVELRLPANWRD